MALETKLVRSGGAQQVFIVSTVRLVADRASLVECRLMQHGFLHLFSLIAVAGEAGFHWIRLQESGRLSSMWVMASDAIALRAGMLHLRRFDLLRLLIVAAHAERAAVGGGENNLAILRGKMAAIAHLTVEGRVQERLHQLRFRRFVRIVALQTVRRFERLILMCLLQASIFRVVALDTKRRNIFLQVRREFDLVAIAVFVSQVAGVAAHIESCVTASVLRNIDSDVVAGKAKVLVTGRARCRLQQLLWIVRLMRIMALNAIPDRGRMDRLAGLYLLLVVTA